MGVMQQRILSPCRLTHAATHTRRYDMSVIEQCAEFKECASYGRMHELGKPLFGIEYRVQSASACQKAVETHHVQMKFCDGSSAAGTCKGAPLLNCYSA